MSVIQRMSIELEARRLIARARKVNRAAARARGENTRRLCTCGYCVRYWTIRGLAVIASNGAQLALLLHFHVI